MFAVHRFCNRDCLSSGLSWSFIFQCNCSFHLCTCESLPAVVELSHQALSDVNIQNIFPSRIFFIGHPNNWLHCWLWQMKCKYSIIHFGSVELLAPHTWISLQFYNFTIIANQSTFFIISAQSRWGWVILGKRWVISYEVCPPNHRNRRENFPKVKRKIILKFKNMKEFSFMKNSWDSKWKLC